MIKLLKNKQGFVLASDYLGMVIATIAIPIILFSYLGLGVCSPLIALTNLFFIFFVFKKNFSRIWVIPSYLFMAFALIYFREVINSGFSNLYSLKFIS